MRKFLTWTSILLLTLFWAGCRTVSPEEERIPVDYTVAAVEEIPAELMKQIEQSKEQEFQMSYNDQRYLYLAIGYGRQEAGGYSIQVESVTESEQEVHVHTVLQGPPAEGQIAVGAAYPYIVLKMETRDKIVMFHT